MWMRVVSSWVCMLLYMWSLLAPVLLPDRCVSFSVSLCPMAKVSFFSVIGSGTFDICRFFFARFEHYL